MFGPRFVPLEEHGFNFIRRRVPRVIRAKDIPEVGVDARVIVNDQDAMVWCEGCAFHVFLCVSRGSNARPGAVVGNSRVNSAPWPRPALWAVRRPPISLAALAPLWRPKPCPSFLVVKPWLKIR